MRNSTLLSFLLVGIVTVSCQGKPHGGTKAKPHELTNRMPLSSSDHHNRGERATETSSLTVTKPTPHTKLDGQNGSPPELQLHHVTEHNIRKNRDDKVADVNVVPANKMLNSSEPSSLSNSKQQNDDIPMESEHLIHVTQKPSKAQKPQKNHKNLSKPHGRRSNPGVAKVHHKATSLSLGGKKKPHHKTNSSVSGKPHHKHQSAIVKSSNIKVKSSEHTPAGPKPKSHKSIKKFNSKKHGWKKANRKEKAAEKQKEKRERREKKAKAMHHSVEKKN